MSHAEKTESPVVAVVGGGGAIGRAISECFGRGGGRIALIDRDEERLRDAADRLATQRIAVQTYGCDITDLEQAATVVRTIAAEMGRLDVLVHSAGLTQVSMAQETDIAVYRRVMDVNFFGVVAITRAALPYLTATRGQIIVLSSVAGFAPLVGRTGYCASKYALHGFFETLRCELAGQGVSILLVCPSFVDSAFARHGLAGDGTQLREDRAISGKPASPEQVARAIFRAARRRRDLLVLSWRGKLAYWLTRVAPTWYARAMTRRFTTVLKQPPSSAGEVKR